MPILSKMMRQFVHQGDIQIALGILDHLGRLGHLDRRSAMHARLDDALVQGGNLFQRIRRIPGDDFYHLGQSALAIPGLMRSGE